MLPKYDPDNEIAHVSAEEDTSKNNIVVREEGSFKSINTLVVGMSACSYLFGNGVDTFFQARHILIYLN